MLFSITAKLFVSIKVIRTYHGAKNRYQEAEHICFRLTRRWIDMNIFVSKSFRRTYAHINRIGENDLRSRIVYNGIVVRNAEVYHSTSKKLNKYRFIMVGNYTGERDQFFVVKLLHRIREKYPESTLQLVGNVKNNVKSQNLYKKCLSYGGKNGLEKKVEFVHNVIDVIPYLFQSDIFIYESTRDTFGIAIVEAMMCGLPCIVNDLDVFQEISNEGNLAVLFKTGDIDDCVEKTLSVLNNYQYHKEQAMKNISKVKEKYSMERYAQNLNEIYQEVARGM